MRQLWKISPEAKKTTQKGETQDPKEDAKDDAKKSRLRVAFEWPLPPSEQERIHKSSPDPKYQGACVVWVWDDIDQANSLRSLMFLRDRIACILCDPTNADPSGVFAITGRINCTKSSSSPQVFEKSPTMFSSTTTFFCTPTCVGWTASLR